jgi:septal ring factor EnvC (AmiA/AmiB activator)
MPDTVALVSLVLGLLSGLLPLLEKFLRKQLGREKEESYSDKLNRLTGSLQKASGEVDTLLKELASVAKTRATAVADLETQLRQLSDREQELKKRVEDLQATPIPVAEHFAALISKGERRSALRDYVLFGMGVVVSTVIAIILRIAGLG